MSESDSNENVKQAVQRRGISRLCHFTRLDSLAGIVQCDFIWSSSEIARDPKYTSHRNDLERSDGRTEYVSCTIQYPNLWTLDRYKKRYRSACTHWITLCIDPDLLWKTGTCFCPVNAARDSGNYVKAGIAGLTAMYNPKPPSRYRIVRYDTHLENCPTDDQAEVLIEDAIEFSSVHGVVVETPDAETQVRSILQYLPSADRPKIVILPAFFEKYSLRRKISNGVETNPTFTSAQERT